MTKSWHLLQPATNDQESIRAKIMLLKEATHHPRQDKSEGVCQWAMSCLSKDHGQPMEVRNRRQVLKHAWDLNQTKLTDLWRRQDDQRKTQNHWSLAINHQMQAQRHPRVKYFVPCFSKMSKAAAKIAKELRISKRISAFRTFHPSASPSLRISWNEKLRERDMWNCCPTQAITCQHRLD